MSQQPQTIGKRKSRDQITNLNSNTSSMSDEEHSSKLQALFRQHFEASFKPLDGICQPTGNHETVEYQQTEDGVESDWEGISDEDRVEAHVIQHQSSQTLKPAIPHDEYKSFMSSKPPSLSSLPMSTVHRKQYKEAGSEEAITDAANLKNDLALQRLLRESHLLDPKSSLSHSGQNRHKAMDLRLQNIGSKNSLYHQQNMPMAQRKGIAIKAAGKEVSRRKEAKENGIILEKVVKVKKGNDKRRQRGIGAPTVGKFKGGMLKLSQKDVIEIEGPSKMSKSRR